MQWYFNSEIKVYSGDRFYPDDIEIEAPPSPTHTFDGTQWQAPPKPTLEELKAAKLTELSAQCTEQIEQGFDSNALGTVHHYGGKTDNQVNLIGGVLIGVTIPYTCTNSEGVKTQRMHTNAQIKRVFGDGAMSVTMLTARYSGLRSKVNAATTAEELAKIIWG